MYDLGSVPPDQRVGSVAWEHLQKQTTLGTHATETLSTFVVHADRDEAVSSLTGIAADPSQREALRAAALSELKKIGAFDEIARLASRITDPPSVTWQFHLALMYCLKQGELACPEAKYLRDVDNLDVQESLAGLL
jgi:hypothetical protein